MKNIFRSRNSPTNIPTIEVGLFISIMIISQMKGLLVVSVWFTEVAI